MKKEIIERLLKEGHITFAEALTLAEHTKETIYVQQVPEFQPYYNFPRDVTAPFRSPTPYSPITCDNGQK